MVMAMRMSSVFTSFLFLSALSADHYVFPSVNSRWKGHQCTSRACPCGACQDKLEDPEIMVGMPGQAGLAELRVCM